MTRQLTLAAIVIASLIGGGCAQMRNTTADNQAPRTVVFAGQTASPSMSGNAGAPGRSSTWM